MTAMKSTTVRKLLQQNSDKQAEPLHALFTALAESLERAEKAEAKLEAVYKWGEKYALPQDGKDELDAILDDQ